jgi:hypothetical protein
VVYERGTDLWYLTIPDLHATEFLKAVATLKNARFARWQGLAYLPNESDAEVYVTSFLNCTASGRSQPVAEMNQSGAATAKNSCIFERFQNDGVPVNPSR